MSLRSLTTALTLYRGTSLTLERAATHGGISPAELESGLRSQGVPVPECERASTTERARD
ncbi:hypothetical protein ACFQFH_08600 [Halobaculum halobium]|uniref:Uncharacterized protein n=1 Tax=Halobaculum halobium TaxID=3032281 RepID=A0ABD5TFJ6_9EURY|nr:hypothetical protein [Halobaculum sp. SYNS20]